VTLVRVFLSHAEDKTSQDEISLTYAHRIHGREERSPVTDPVWLREFQEV
jgi:hypothetical protein